MIFRKETKSMREKVVIYSEAFLPNIGGGENYCVDLARTLSDLGEDVTVVTPIQTNTVDTFNFDLIRLRNPIFLGFNINFLEPLFHIIREKPKVVILSGPAISDFAMIPFLGILRFPVVVVFHGQFNRKWARVLMKIIAPANFDTITGFPQLTASKTTLPSPSPSVLDGNINISDRQSSPIISLSLR